MLKQSRFRFIAAKGWKKSSDTIGGPESFNLDLETRASCSWQDALVRYKCPGEPSLVSLSTWILEVGPPSAATAAVVHRRPRRRRRRPSRLRN